jgi:hypothetical protein
MEAVAGDQYLYNHYRSHSIEKWIGDTQVIAIISLIISVVAFFGTGVLKMGGGSLARAPLDLVY